MTYLCFEQTDEALSIYLEYVSGGSIHKLLRDYGPFKEPVIRNYTRQILSGLAYLHGRNTMHRYCKLSYCVYGPFVKIQHENNFAMLFLAETSKEQTYLLALLVTSNLLTSVWLKMYAVSFHFVQGVLFTCISAEASSKPNFHIHTIISVFPWPASQATHGIV